MYMSVYAIKGLMYGYYYNGQLFAEPDTEISVTTQRELILNLNVRILNKIAQMRIQKGARWNRQQIYKNEVKCMELYRFTRADI